MEHRDEDMNADSDKEQEENKLQEEEESEEDFSIAEHPNLARQTKLLAKMGYCIVKSEEDGQHRFLQTDSHEKFKFVDQKHYDKLGDKLCDWVQAFMMDKLKLNKVMIPFKEELSEGAAQAPIFVSEDWETNTERALVLIQGTGDVRSGYWARSVCMNDTMELGSMIPDIEFARNNGFSVIVFNPNYNRNEQNVTVDDKIRGMGHHSSYAWNKFVENGVWPAKEIFMVAHSAGGACAHEIIVSHEDTMIEKVKAIALTDACHGDFYSELTKKGKKWAAESCVAYDSSMDPLDTPLKGFYKRAGFPWVSAGHPKHVYTTGCARESYLKWFAKRSETLQQE